MLVRYSVTNFLSFKEENTIEFIAGQSKGLKEHLIHDKKISILKNAVIYGGNASGKSNFIKSISFAKKIIIKGLKNLDTFNKSFRLDEISKKEPSVFQFEIKLNKKYYDYGFAINFDQKKIMSEWLFEKTEAGDLCVFECEDNKIINSQFEEDESSDFSKFFVYSQDLNNEDLFLTTLALKKWEEEKYKIFHEIFMWFLKSLEIIFPDDGKGTFIFIDQYRELEKYLKIFDTGIESVSVIEKKFDDWIKEINDRARTDLHNHILEIKEDKKNKNIKKEKSLGGIMAVINDITALIEVFEEKTTVKIINFQHLSGTNEVFELFNESDGTKRLVELIPTLHNLGKKNSKTLLIDEIDRSLHPMVTKKIFELFSKLSSKNESQLIATTHESTLLDLKLFRRDEIWFIERDLEKKSNIYSLEEFRVRNDKSILKDYLLGRYGGIPNFGDSIFAGADI